MCIATHIVNKVVSKAPLEGVKPLIKEVRICIKKITMQNLLAVSQAVPNVNIDPDISRATHLQYFNELLNLESESITDSEWIKVVDKSNIQAYKLKLDSSPICVIKAFCKVPYSSGIVFRAIWEPQSRTRWEKLFKDFNVLDKQPDSEIIHYTIKTPIGITKRDWVLRRTFTLDYPQPGSIMIHYVSDTHTAAPVFNKIIRAETMISGYIIRPISDSLCDLTIISHNDVKGKIPKKLVNQVAARAPAKWIKNLEKGCGMLCGN